MNGLSTINIELTSRCNKSCFMCGRRTIDRDYPGIKMNYGDMSWHTLKLLQAQIPPNIVVQFHSNGEPTLYPQLKLALELFPNNFRHFDTNAKLIVKRADDIIDNLDTMTISVIENDPEGDEQYKIVKEFLDIKGDRKPKLIYRLLGNVENHERWEKLPGIVATRILHHPLGSFEYEGKPTIPEIGVCLDLLHHLTVDRFGNVYPCVRFNPKMLGILGNVNHMSLIEMWNSKERQLWIQHHMEGNRDKVPICKSTECEYWGVPTGHNNYYTKRSRF